MDNENIKSRSTELVENLGAHAEFDGNQSVTKNKQPGTPDKDLISVLLRKISDLTGTYSPAIHPQKYDFVFGQLVKNGASESLASTIALMILEAGKSTKLAEEKLFKMIDGKIELTSAGTYYLNKFRPQSSKYVSIKKGDTAKPQVSREISY
jgi:hypothetical protein|tara:strand:- start:2713 stop:3168 length:456 start_codon:yes stop_codon:yes gene_type:complete